MNELAAAVYQGTKAEILQRLKMSEDATTLGFIAIGSLGTFALSSQAALRDWRGTVLLLIPFVNLVTTASVLRHDEMVRSLNAYLREDFALWCKPAPNPLPLWEHSQALLAGRAYGLQRFVHTNHIVFVGSSLASLLLGGMALIRMILPIEALLSWDTLREHWPAGIFLGLVLLVCLVACASTISNVQRMRILWEPRLNPRG